MRAAVTRALLLVVLLPGCAVGRVGEGEVVGLAVGPSARLSVCREGYADELRQMSTNLGRECLEIHGSPVSSGFADLLATVGTAAAAYFGL